MKVEAIQAYYTSGKETTYETKVWLELLNLHDCSIRVNQSGTTHSMYTNR